MKLTIEFSLNVIFSYEFQNGVQLSATASAAEDLLLSVRPRCDEGAASLQTMGCPHKQRVQVQPIKMSQPFSSNREKGL